MLLKPTTNGAQNAEEKALNEALSKLEAALLSPVVSGELISWAQNALAAAKELEGPLQRFIEKVLRPQYAEISRSDEELLPRVQQMGQEDQALLQEVGLFQKELDELARRAPGVENDESKLENSRLNVEQRGTELILRIRRQQAAVATWLSEALLRDRGAVD